MFVDEKRHGEVAVEEDRIVKELKTARSCLIRDGWCQENYEDSFGRHCAVGAICKKGPYSEDWPVDVIGYLLKAIDHYSVPHWNDTNGRTQAQVIAAYDKAIALRQREL